MVKKAIPKPKYKVGDMVYSYQNMTEMRPINYVRPSKEYGFPHAYRISLKGGNSNWISENSVAKTKGAKKLK